MNIEEIKESWFDGYGRSLLTDEIDWLIAEIEILKAKNGALIRGIESIEKDVSTRCAEIASKTIEADIGSYPTVFGKKSADAIRKEFNLDDKGGSH